MYLVNYSSPKPIFTDFIDFKHATFQNWYFKNFKDFKNCANTNWSYYHKIYLYIWIYKTSKIQVTQFCCALQVGESTIENKSIVQVLLTLFNLRNLLYVWPLSWNKVEGRCKRTHTNTCAGICVRMSMQMLRRHSLSLLQWLLVFLLMTLIWGHTLKRIFWGALDWLCLSSSI